MHSATYLNAASNVLLWTSTVVDLLSDPLKVIVNQNGIKLNSELGEYSIAGSSVVINPLTHFAGSDYRVEIL